jgi:transcriptional regulator with XRE-family HTH domain
MRQVNGAGVPIVAISRDEREFFQALGARIARLRKDSQITQVQLAEVLSVSQQTVNAYEMGHRRVPVSALPTLAKALGVSLEELIGQPIASSRKRGPAPKLQQHIERISQLPKAKQRFVMQVLESVLAQASR